MRIKQDTKPNFLELYPLPAAIVHSENGILEESLEFKQINQGDHSWISSAFAQQQANDGNNPTILELNGQCYEAYLKLQEEHTLWVAIGRKLNLDSTLSFNLDALNHFEDLVFLTCDTKGHILWVNQNFEPYFGPVKQSLNLLDLFPQNKRELKQLLKPDNAKKPALELNFSKDDRPRHFLLESSSFKSNQRSAPILLCSLREISAEREVREALSAQLHQNRGILEAIPDLVFRVSKDGTYLSCQANDPKDLLVPMDQITGMNFHDMPESEELKSSVWKKIQSTLRDGKIRTAEYQRINLKSHIQHYEARITRSGKDEVVYFVRNITSSKDYLNKLSLSEKKWSSIVQNSFDGILLCDEAGQIKFISRNVKRLLQADPNQFEGHNLMEFIEERQRPKFREIYGKLKSKSGNKSRDNLRIKLQGREPVEIEASMVNMLDKDGVESIVINYRDISERIRFEEAIVEANSNLAAVVENTNEMIWMMTPDRHFKLYNSSFYEGVLQEYGIKLYKDMPLEELKDDDTIAFWENIYQKIEKSHEPEKFRMTNTNGQSFDVCVTPILSKEDTILGFSAFATNVTEVVRYENHIIEQQHTINTMLNTTSAAIMILEHDRIVYTNNRCMEMFGFSEEELEGMPVGLILHPEERHMVSERVAKRAKGNRDVFSYENRVITKQGKLIWVDVHSAPVMYKGKNCIIATLNDITKLKEQEKVLIEAKEGAEELTRLKSTFLANMSHEIRTPLNGVLGLAELIESSDNLEEIKEMVELQKHSGKRLLETLTSILHLSRLEAENNSVNVERIHLLSFLEELKKAFEPQYRKKKLFLEIRKIDPEWHIMADDIMLYQVFNNLLSNAWKFTDNGGVTISGRIESKEDADSELVIRVKDTGIGMTKEFLPHIFDSFRQESQGISRRYEGSGLGLAIAKKYLHLLNGDLTVSSAKGKGSTFEVRLPLKN